MKSKNSCEFYRFKPKEVDFDENIYLVIKSSGSSKLFVYQT